MDYLVRTKRLPQPVQPASWHTGPHSSATKSDAEDVRMHKTKEAWSIPGVITSSKAAIEEGFLVRLIGSCSFGRDVQVTRRDDDEFAAWINARAKS